MEGLRKRQHNEDWKTKHHSSQDTNRKLLSERVLRQPVILLIVAFHGVLFLIVHCRQAVYPTPLGLNAPSDTFSEERARTYLRGIVSFGIRQVGSVANEKLVVDYLLRELEKIKRNVNEDVNSLDIDSKRVSGSFSLGFLSEFTSIYEQVNNIVARLTPKSGSKDALLVNCHYDSGIGSPGASDDAVSCSLMLEVLRILAVSNKPLRHTIIFLFNGAEENILQASHGFITQHPWAKDIKAFVNLEAAGAGGWELLFQAGPENPWLLRAYVENVPYPSASIVGQELFQSNIIPSDTDYRIFRDYGNIPGIDIAYISNGYVYHTKYDDESRIHAGCIQRGGENLLVLLRAIANSDKLRDPGDDRHGSLVFYDFLGITTVVYPKRIGEIINLLTVVLVTLGLLRKSPHHKAHGRIHNVIMIIKACGWMLLSWFLMIAFAVTVGGFMYVIGRQMTWFTNSWLLLGLFIAPEIFITLYFHHFIRTKLYQNENAEYLSFIFHNAVLVLFSIPLFVMTIMGICSAVLALYLVLFPWLLQQQLGGRLGKTVDSIGLVMHFISLLVPCILFHYFLHDTTSFFIPIMGRSGTEVLPDIVIGVFVSCGFIVLSAHHVQLVYMLKSVRELLICLGSIFVIVVLLATVTPVGFPYRGTVTQPTCQRHVIKHVERTFHDISGTVIKQDSHILFFPLDANALDYVSSAVPRIASAKRTTCEHAPYCGWPFYFPIVNLLRKSYVLPAQRLTSLPNATLSVRKELISNGVHRLHITFTGPDHMTVYLMPEAGVSVVRWSLGSGHAQPSMVTTGNDGRQLSSYFIYYSHGQKPSVPFTFWVELNVEAGTDVTRGILEVAMAAHHFTPQSGTEHSPDLRDVIASLPDWTVPLSWIAIYESWIV